MADVHAWITTGPIDAGEVLSVVGAGGNGATVLFLGHVRDENAGRAVAAVRYEAYLEMAEPILAEIAAEAAARLGSGSVAIVHRIGELRVGELSVAIAVSSPHRAAAFDAAREAIEAIKRRLPIWKHERYLDGAADWLPGASPSAGGHA